MPCTVKPDLGEPGRGEILFYEVKTQWNWKEGQFYCGNIRE